MHGLSKISPTPDALIGYRTKTRNLPGLFYVVADPRYQASTGVKME